MASQIIGKVPHNKVGKAKDNELIELSWQQLTPGNADPTEFVVLQPDAGVNAETAGHGRHGRNSAEYRRLLAMARADKGKGLYRKPE